MPSLARSLCLIVLPFLLAADWPQWGGTAARNNVATGKGLPVEWEAGSFDKAGHWKGSPDSPVRWAARLGGESYGSPVIVGDQVYCATNNGAGYLKRYPANVDLGCLLCFARADGKFLWQYSAEKLALGRSVDWPKQGICSAPLVEGNRLWVVDSRGQVVCLDTAGFRDGKNDGPVTDEPSHDAAEADVVWRFDMMKELGTRQRYMSCCSVTAAGDLLLAGTSNGTDQDDRVTFPQAASFIALNKHTGALVWADNSPGGNILEGQWSSPAYGVLGGVPQAIFAGGDGWVYSFLAQPSDDRRPKLLWKFDCNPKTAVWEAGGSGQRNQIIATPVIADGHVFVATGQDPEAGEGPGDLWRIDPTRRGDTSAELVVDADGKPVPPGRKAAVDTDAGQKVLPNPNSAAVWHYRGAVDKTKGGKADFKQVMHRSLGSPVIHDGLLVIGDFAGLVHCLDAQTGQTLWTHDLMSAIWGTPLVADGKIYLGTEDGDVVVFACGRQEKLLAKNALNGSIYGTITLADNVLYVATRSHLFAIGEEKGK